MLHPLGEEHVIAMLESMSEALYTLDREWRFTYINRRCEQLWGQPRSSLLGRVIWEAFPQLIGTRSEEYLRRAMEQQHIVVLETNSPVVKRWVEVHVHPSEPGVAVYFHDIHDRKLAADEALRRAAHLQAISAALSGALTPESVADVILEHSLSALGAVAASVRVVTDDGQHLRELRARGYPEEWLSANRLIPLSLARATTEAIRLGQPILLESADVVVARYPDYQPLVQQHGYQAFGVIPLQVDGRIIGSLGFLFTEPKTFTVEDRTFLYALAQQCALALDRARLYTAERAARATATETLALLDTFVSKAPIGLAFVDRDFRFVRINERLAAINGLPVEAHVGQRAADLFPHLAPTWEMYWRQVLDTGQPIVNSELAQVVDGVSNTAQVSYFPVRGPEDAIVGIGIVVEDITERKQAEFARTLLASTNSALAGSLDEASILANIAHIVTPEFADLCITYLVADDGALRRVEVAHVLPEKAELVRELHRRYPPDLTTIYGPAIAAHTGAMEYLPHFPTELPPAVQKEAGRVELLRAINPRSYLTLPLRVHERTLGAIQFIITEREYYFTPTDVALAEELARRCAMALENTRLYTAEQKARAEAEAALRLREQFLALAAHELKTPLTSLMGNAQLVQRRFKRNGALADNDARYLGVVVEQAGRLNQMISALLDVSRIHTGQLSIERASFDLDTLVRRVINEVQLGLTNHHLVYYPPGGSLTVEGDELRLEQVLLNLIQNAVKYSPQGGEISVRLERQKAWARLSVTDQGIGIPQEAQQYLFQRFYRAGNAETHHISGMGIGLYVVKEIVSLHGGAVAAESQEGQGSTFFVYLPLPQL